MRNGDMEIRIASSSGRPQLIMPYIKLYEEMIILHMKVGFGIKDSRSILFSTSSGMLIVRNNIGFLRT